MAEDSKKKKGASEKLKTYKPINATSVYALNDQSLNAKADQDSQDDVINFISKEIDNLSVTVPINVSGAEVPNLNTNNQKKVVDCGCGQDDVSGVF